MGLLEQITSRIRRNYPMQLIALFSSTFVLCRLHGMEFLQIRGNFSHGSAELYCSSSHWCLCKLIKEIKARLAWSTADTMTTNQFNKVAWTKKMMKTPWTNKDCESGYTKNEIWKWAKDGPVLVYTVPKVFLIFPSGRRGKWDFILMAGTIKTTVFYHGIFSDAVANIYYYNGIWDHF